MTSRPGQRAAAHRATPLRAAALRATALGAALLLLGACTGPDDVGRTATAGDDGLRGTLTVFAAASLTDAFEEIGVGFRQEHPDVELSFSFAGSSSLAAQVVSGAPADVFAAASSQTMRRVTEAGRALGEPEVFARNRLQIAVPSGNPAGVEGLDDLAREGIAVALCAPEVPCGAATETLLAAAGVTASPDTLEQDVRAALSKAELGEVDAALVYRTDVLSAGAEVEGIDVPEATQAVNDYPVVALRDAPNPAAARAFVGYVLSPEGQRVLAAAGFDAP